MPCNTVQTATVELGKVNEDLLKAALKSLKVANYSLRNGQLTMTMPWNDMRLPTLAQVKVAYSREVVLSQAKKFGWEMKETAPNQWQVVRR